jgi:hypothetical protein
MSQENVEIVEAATAAFNAGDMDAYIGLCALSVEAYPDAGFPESRPLHGRRDFREWVEGLRAPWTSSRWIVHQARAIRPDRVFQRGEWRAVGAGSDIEISASYTIIYTVRDDLITKLEWFSHHDEALKAVGLEE